MKSIWDFHILETNLTFDYLAESFNQGQENEDHMWYISVGLDQCLPSDT